LRPEIRTVRVGEHRSSGNRRTTAGKERRQINDLARAPGFALGGM